MNTGIMPKIDDDLYWKQLYRRLLKSGFIRYTRTKDGRSCFVSTPAGRRAVQEMWIYVHHTPRKPDGKKNS